MKRAYAGTYYDGVPDRAWWEDSDGKAMTVAFDADIALWHGKNRLFDIIIDKGIWCNFCVSLLLGFHSAAIIRPSFECGCSGFKDLSVYDAGGFMKAIMCTTAEQLTDALVKVIEKDG